MMWIIRKSCSMCQTCSGECESANVPKWVKPVFSVEEDVTLTEEASHVDSTQKESD